eukprot:m.1637604 g.1637604  ORF g.1637604 m.1637604 type:complete len:434 (+) comp25978_c0_seq1:186-1487(+)
MSAQANAIPIGYRFVQQYYRSLNSDPAQLHRFYAPERSALSHGLEGDNLEPLVGQEAINSKITSLGMKDCKADIKQVDCQQISDEFILIQVIGWLSNDNAPMRKFCQSFCLQKVEMNGNLSVRYSICNDIFRYLAEPVEEEATPTAEAAAPVPDAPTEAAPSPKAAIAPAAVVEEAPVSVVESTNAENDATTESTAATPAPVEAEVEEAAEAAMPEPAAMEEEAAKTTAPVQPAAAPAHRAPFSYANAAGKVKAAAPPAATPPAATAPPPVPIGTPAEGTNNQRPRGPGPRAAGNGHVGGGGVLHVRNLPPQCTAGDLFDTFKVYGQIRANPKNGITIHVSKSAPKNNNHPPVRYAFIDFENGGTAVARCLQDVENGKEFVLHGQRVLVDRQRDSHRGSGRGRFGGRGGFGRGGHGPMRGGGHRGGRGGGDGR